VKLSTTDHFWYSKLKQIGEWERYFKSFKAYNNHFK
jgi:hypothetical protein